VTAVGLRDEAADVFVLASAALVAAALVVRIGLVANAPSSS
jgi:hypothetical protein